MARRTTWIIAGTLTIIALLVCVAVGVGSFAMWRFYERQQAQSDRIRATLTAGIDIPEPDATYPPLPTAQPIPTIAATAAPVATPTYAAPPDFAAALAPAQRTALAQHSNATLYRIDAQLDAAQHTISGTQTLELTNTEDQPLSELYFRLYVNAPHYNEGGITITDVRVDGLPAPATLEVQDTALKIPLRNSLVPGQRTTISMRFTTTIPTSDGGYGIFNESNGVFALYNWHPELAVYEKGGWLLNPVNAQGDPTNTDVANYVVSFAAPADFDVVSSGVEAAPTRSADGVRYEIVSALTRNFVVVASDRFAHATQQAGDTTINAYYLPQDETGGKATLAAAAKAATLFSNQFGPYSYPELDVVEVDIGGGAAGMESTGLIMIGSTYYDPSSARPLASLAGTISGAQNLSVLDFITAHEVAHQWWYGMVGSDAYAEPWLDESLTNWSSAFFIDQTVNADVGLLARDVLIRGPYTTVLKQHDERLDQPVDRFSGPEYSGIVYGKGALMYDVLRQQLGNEQFFAFLRRYYAQHQFARVDGEGWRATLAEVAGEQTANAFYDRWVEGTDIRTTDLPPGGALAK